MNVRELKNYLNNASGLNFKLPSGTYVPAHFHVTEIGYLTKHFIDCGGTVRVEKLASIQLWNSDDTAHRLKPEKLAKIISISEKLAVMEDLEIEVEYQTETIGKYDLEFNGTDFLLVSKTTACLASDSCGISSPEFKSDNNSTCKPGGGCC